ncbi:hypothetical protein ABZ484_06055 [Streptomyces sp. NPDC006393]|uniref:hypothetical protein n=1 Tax=Streptomyces sp. NPDC006393 TaxID=3156763 RepID=UPI0033EEE028
MPLRTGAGEWLERYVAVDPLVRRHAERGDGMLPWALGLFVPAAGVWLVSRRTPATRAGARSGTVVRVAAAVLSVVVVGAVVEVYRIGDSGAKAAWHDACSKTATRPGDGD